MAQYQIHEKNKTLYANIQIAEGTYEESVATEALPVISIDGSVTTETGSFEYLGDAQSRDEHSYTQDQFAEFAAETPQQVLGVLDGARTVAEVPQSTWLQACAGYITVFSVANGSFPAGTVVVDNYLASNDMLSIDFRKSSASDLVNDKNTPFYDCRGSVDLALTIGDVPKLKFNMKGNAKDPIQVPTIVPQYGTQLTDVAAAVRDVTVQTIEIARRDGAFATGAAAITTITNSGNFATVTFGAAHGLGSNGSIRFIEIIGANEAEYNGIFLAFITSATTVIYRTLSVPAGSATGTLTWKEGEAAKTFCFGNTNAPNFFGFEYARSRNGCGNSFTKKAVASEVTVSLLENKAPAVQIANITSTTTTATATAYGHGFTSGDSVTISEVPGTDGDFYNGTFDVTVTDADTFTYTITSYAGTYAGKARAVNNNFASFDPDSHISDFYGAIIKFGTAAGSYISYGWDKLQIRDVKEGKIEEALARDVTFRNTGKSFIIYE